MSLPEVIDVHALAAGVASSYDNRALAEVDDHVVRMSVMTEPFYWHRHPTSDETFLIVEGRLEIAFEDGAIELDAGQMATVPAGVVHKTRPLTERTVNLTFERRDEPTERVTI